jgi:hypothetical protein
MQCEHNFLSLQPPAVELCCTEPARQDVEICPKVDLGDRENTHTMLRPQPPPLPHTQTHSHTDTHTQTHTHTHTHACTHAHTCTHTLRTHAHICLPHEPFSGIQTRCTPLEKKKKKHRTWHIGGQTLPSIQPSSKGPTTAPKVHSYYGDPVYMPEVHSYTWRFGGLSQTRNCVDQSGGQLRRLGPS